MVREMDDRTDVTGISHLERKHRDASVLVTTINDGDETHLRGRDKPEDTLSISDVVHTHNTMNKFDKFHDKIPSHSDSRGRRSCCACMS